MKSLGGGLACLVLVAAGTSALEPRAVGRAVEGGDWARMLPPPGSVQAAYENSGYRLQFDQGEVTVEVTVTPLGSSRRFVLPRKVARDPLGRLAGTVTTGAKTRYEAVSRVLGWVARNVRYDLDRSQPQDPLSVLKRRTGYCTGIARLCVALLSSVEIPAREVVGYVVGEGVGERGYHRWIEVSYGDRGWLFSDPLVSHHYVPATYIRLAEDRVELVQPREGRLLERRRGLVEVDVYPGAPAAVTARRNSPKQLLSALRVLLGGRGRGRAILEGAGKRHIQPMVEGSSSFVGLEPGSYRLNVKLSGGGQVQRQVEIGDRVRSSLYLPAAATGNP